MNLSTSARELRCPTPHAKFKGSCNKLLGRYDAGLSGTVEIHCRRCDTPTVFVIRSSSTSSLEVRAAS